MFTCASRCSPTSVLLAAHQSTVKRDREEDRCVKVYEPRPYET